MYDLSFVFTTHGLISLLTLTVLEIVLGIDNIIFVSIVADRLPQEKQAFGRTFGLLIALVIRIILLLGIGLILGLTENLFTVFEVGISGKDLILLGGGLFLIAKSTSEIRAKFNDAAENISNSKKAVESFAMVIIQIVVIDLVFSFDSILTAIGLVQNVIIMIISVIISMGIMLMFINPVSEFVENNPTVKMLALSFLIMIGTLLVAEAMDVHMPKGYVYFAMAFAFTVEMLNLKMRKGKTVQN